MISVIIPMYNSAGTIISALESVKKQDYEGKVEIIVVNDGSTDNSLHLAEQYRASHDELNIHIINKPNGGVASARNAGIKDAKGEFIALLDSDDEWLEDKLKIIMPYFSNPKIGCIGSGRNGELLKCGFKKIKNMTKILPIDLIFRWNPQTSTVVLRKTVIDIIGLYNENMKYAEDGEYWLRIAHNCGFFVIPDSLVITGHGKCNYGESGLSGNLIEMHKGELQAINSAYSMGAISLGFCYIAKFFAKLKYIRRKIIVHLRKT